MWLSKWCYLCLVNSRVGDLIKVDRVEQIPRLLNRLSDLIPHGRTTSFVESFNFVAAVAGGDPYKKVKEELSEVGRSIASRLREDLADSGWDLGKALRYSAAANIIDTSVLGYEPVELERAIYDRPAVEEEVDFGGVRRIAIALDNAGEAHIDLLLAEALVRNGFEVSLVVRGSPYEIDVTSSDLVADFDVVMLPDSYPVFKHGVPQVDLVLAKGIANLEAYLEWGGPPTVHLLRAKCNVLADLLKVPKNSPLIIRGSTVKRLVDEARATARRRLH